MEFDEQTYLKLFYQSLDHVKPADPRSKQYVPLYDNRELAPADPIAALQTTIDWAAIDSCQLFSGFRGTGKSTELRRLKLQLERDTDKIVVILCDMQDHMNLSTPVDISDFLMSVAGAFGEAIAKDGEALGVDVIKEGYWTRFRNFMARTNVEFTEIGVSGELGVGGELKANLKADPSFRQRLQEKMQGHIGALTADVHHFLEECVQKLRLWHGDDVKIVLLLDSVEQIQGSAVNAVEVAESVSNLFFTHARRLRLPYIHTVYTVPPWLSIKSPATAVQYDSYQQIPCVKVRTREGEPFQPGLDVLEQVIAQRGDWTRLLGSREALDEILLASGGYLRDLFRLLQAALRLSRTRGLPASKDTRLLALHEVRNAYLPINHHDVLWLSRIDTSKNCELPHGADLADLARFFDNLLVMTYRNGGEWFGIHPLIADRVREIAASIRRREQSEAPTA